MATGSGQSLGKENILAKLAQADELARERGDELADEVGDWRDRVAFLITEKCPRSYLPVLCVLLTARAMRDKSQLDVLAVTANASAHGYSAQSVGKYLIRFATHCHIDLRSRSTQVMNSQPFTNEKFIVEKMSGDAAADAYAEFYADACVVQDLEPSEALAVLAYIFHIRRSAGDAADTTVVVDGGREAYEKLVAATVKFVEGNSDHGKVGQAFAAALYDLLYGPDNVRMGNNHDPSFGVAGDVQVGVEPHYWLHSEVKQTSITSAEVQTFLDRVARDGGERAAYFALSNHRYPDQLSLTKLSKSAARLGIDQTIYLSPQAAIDDLLVKAPGTFSQVAGDLATRLSARLEEAQVASTVEELWKKLLADFT